MPKACYIDSILSLPTLVLIAKAVFRAQTDRQTVTDTTDHPTHAAVAGMGI